MATGNQVNGIDYRAVLSAMWKRRKLFYKVLSITFVLSIAYIYCIPRYYMTDTKMAPEAESSIAGGTLGSIASSFGFDLSDMETSDAITPMLYPDLMEDNGFVTGLFPIKVKTQDGSINTTYYEYLKKHQKEPWWSRVIYSIISLFPKKQESGAGGKGEANPYILSKADDDVAGAIRNNIKLNTDKKTGVITITVKAQGPTSIEKQGSGDWRLTGKNIYTGTTTVSKGRLIVNGQHTGTGAINVRSGAILAGSGTLAGTTTINQNATLQVGDTLINGRGLTFGGALKVNSGGIVNVLADRTKSNTLTLKGALTLTNGAILQINEGEIAEAPYNKTEYQVFNISGGSITGTFAEIQPATPGEGQTWDTSELYTNGIIKVVGGEDNPDQTIVDPQPVGETKTALLAWGNMIAKSYDNSSYNNMMVGAENDEAFGFSMVITGNLAKAYTSAGTPKLDIEYKGEMLQRTAIKLSNGAQNTIFMPEGAKATKMSIYSITGTNASNRTSYWKEVAGVNYTETTTTVLDLDAPRSNPNKVDFTLDNVPDKVTFTNTGEQQCVIIYLEYHFGGDTSGVESIHLNEPIRIEYYTLSGEKVSTPAKGIYLVRIYNHQGKIESRKVIF